MAGTRAHPFASASKRRNSRAVMSSARDRRGSTAAAVAAPAMALRKSRRDLLVMADYARRGRFVRKTNNATDGMEFASRGGSGPWLWASSSLGLGAYAWGLG